MPGEVPDVGSTSFSTGLPMGRRKSNSATSASCSAAVTSLTIELAAKKKKKGLGPSLDGVAKLRTWAAIFQIRRDTWSQRSGNKSNPLGLAQFCTPVSRDREAANAETRSDSHEEGKTRVAPAFRDSQSTLLVP